MTGIRPTSSSPVFLTKTLIKTNRIRRFLQLRLFRLSDLTLTNNVEFSVPGGTQRGTHFMGSSLGSWSLVHLRDHLVRELGCGSANRSLRDTGPRGVLPFCIVRSLHPPDMPLGYFVPVNLYSNTIRLCRCCMTVQKPSLQSISTKAFQFFGNAFNTALTIREPYPLTADVIS